MGYAKNVRMNYSDEDYRMIEKLKEIYVTLGAWSVVLALLVLAGLGIYLAIIGIKKTLKKGGK